MALNRNTVVAVSDILFYTTTHIFLYIPTNKIPIFEKNTFNNTYDIRTKCYECFKAIRKWS